MPATVRQVPMSIGTWLNDLQPGGGGGLVHQLRHERRYLPLTCG